jgi:hypothetical protein
MPLPAAYERNCLAIPLDRRKVLLVAARHSPSCQTDHRCLGRQHYCCCSGGSVNNTKCRASPLAAPTRSADLDVYEVSHVHCTEFVSRTAAIPTSRGSFGCRIKRRRSDPTLRPDKWGEALTTSLPVVGMRQGAGRAGPVGLRVDASNTFLYRTSGIAYLPTRFRE